MPPDTVALEHLGQLYQLNEPRTTSPSAQKNFLMCPAFDWWKAVAGVREPESVAQAIGTAAMLRVERYLAGELTLEALKRDTETMLEKGREVSLAGLALAALAWLPAPQAPRMRVEEWLSLQWGRSAGMPRIAQKPDVQVLPLVKGVHDDHPDAGRGGSGLFWRRPDYGVAVVEDVKTCSGFGWSLSDEDLAQDTQMVWYGLGVARASGAELVRLGQPQANKRTMVARHAQITVDREHLERVFAKSEALQREMNDVRALRDPGELAAQGLMAWGQCDSVYGRPCPNYERCGAYRPSANGGPTTLAELARETGRIAGGQAMQNAQDSIRQRLFGAAEKTPSALAMAENLRKGGINPPDGASPDPSPDEALGVTRWISPPGANYQIAEGERHGTAFAAYWMDKGFKVFAPPYVGKDPSTHTPMHVEPGNFAGLKVDRMRDMLAPVIAAWDAEVNPPMPEIPDLPAEVPAPDLPEAPAAESPVSIHEAMAAAVSAGAEAAASAPQSTPTSGAEDLEAMSAEYARAGAPGWAQERIPSELGLSPAALYALGEAGAMKDLQNMKHVGEGKARAAWEAVSRYMETQGTPAPVSAVQEVKEEPETAPESSAAEPPPAPAPSPAAPAPSPEGAGEALEKRIAELEAALANSRAYAQALEKREAARTVPEAVEEQPPPAASGYRLLLNVTPIPGGAEDLETILLDDLLAPYIRAAESRLRLPSLELDTKAFGNPYKEVLRELEQNPPPMNRAILVQDVYGNVWKGVRSWFVDRRAWMIQG